MDLRHTGVRAYPKIVVIVNSNVIDNGRSKSLLTVDYGTLIIFYNMNTCTDCSHYEQVIRSAPDSGNPGGKLFPGKKEGFDLSPVELPEAVCTSHE